MVVSNTFSLNIVAVSASADKGSATGLVVQDRLY